MASRKLLVPAVLLASLIAVALCWHLLYPSPDPKRMGYVFWKAGLYRLNPDEALGTMVGDPQRDRLVLGKTKTQLRDKFGVLLTPGEASAYLRGCYEASSWKGKDVRFVRESLWMVVFNQDKATELVLMKGC
jgi:hypothetical protein